MLIHVLKSVKKTAGAMTSLLPPNNYFICPMDFKTHWAVAVHLNLVYNFCIVFTLY